MPDGGQPETPEDLVRQLFQALDVNLIQRQVVGPLQKAAGSFEYDRQEAFSFQLFLQVVANFIRHLYRQGKLPFENLDQAQARSEALALLNRYFSSPDSGTGFENAYLAARRTGSMDEVLAQLANVMAEEQRQRYIQLIGERYKLGLRHLNWSKRLEVMAAALDLAGHALTNDLLQWPPGLLAEYLPEIVKNDQERQVELDNRLRSSPF